MGTATRSLTITFSGEGPISHSDARDLARQLGHEVSGAVREGTDLLVVGHEPSSMKVRQAEKYGVRIIPYEEWIAEGGVAELIAMAQHDDSVLHIPGAYPNDMPASENQIQAVVAFYSSHEIGSLTSDQAGALLDYRDFARSAAEKLNPGLFGERGHAASEQIAVYLSRRRELAEGVVSMMRKRFAQGADPDKLPSAIARTEMFQEVVARFG